MVCWLCRPLIARCRHLHGALNWPYVNTVWTDALSSIGWAASVRERCQSIHDWCARWHIPAVIARSSTVTSALLTRRLGFTCFRDEKASTQQVLVYWFAATSALLARFYRRTVCVSLSVCMCLSVRSETENLLWTEYVLRWTTAIITLGDIRPTPLYLRAKSDGTAQMQFLQLFNVINVSEMFQCLFLVRHTVLALHVVYIWNFMKF